jgi:hypothetical protein
MRAFAHHFAMWYADPAGDNTLIPGNEHGRCDGCICCDEACSDTPSR